VSQKNPEEKGEFLMEVHLAFLSQGRNEQMLEIFSLLR
jgi:hypothetical protein